MNQRELTNLLRAHTPHRAPAIDLPAFPEPVPIAGPSTTPWLALAACRLVIAITAVHGHQQDAQLASGSAAPAPADIDFLIATHLAHIDTHEY